MHSSIVFLTWPSAADVKQYFAALTWPEIKHIFNVGKELFTLLVYFLAALAAIGVLWRLPKIAVLLREFQKNSGPIWDLRRTTEDLKEVVPTIAEKLQALQTQVVAIQRNATDNLPIEAPPADSSNSASDDDWESIKKMWADARDRLETIIEEGDGRRTRKYGKLTRYDYTDVIKNLLNDGFINDSIAEDAQHMNDKFLSLRNRKKPITDEVKNEFAKWKKSFDKEVRQFKPQFRNQAAVSNGDSERPPVAKANGGIDSPHPPV